MSQEAKRDGIDVRQLLRFIHEVSVTDIVEQIYAHALTAVQELFTPNRAFVALSESSAGSAHKPAQHPGWLLDLNVPIYAGGKLVGQIMLQYDEAGNCGLVRFSIRARQESAFRTTESASRRINCRTSSKGSGKVIFLA